MDRFSTASRDAAGRRAGGERDACRPAAFGWHTFSEEMRRIRRCAARRGAADGRAQRNAIRRVESLAKYPEQRLTLLLAPRFLRAFCRTNEIPAVAAVTLIRDVNVASCKAKGAGSPAKTARGEGRGRIQIFSSIWGRCRVVRRFASSRRQKCRAIFN